MNNADNLNRENLPVETTAEINPEAERFYAGAEQRMLRMALFVAAGSAAAVMLVFGPKVAMGFAIGAAVAVLNFRWQHATARNATASMAGQAVSEGKARVAGASLVFGLALRLALVTAAGYAIFRGSRESFHGFLGGLAMPLAAMFAEAIYEAWVALRRGL